MAAAFTSLDLFCGCGGFSLGLEQAGFETIAAIDFDPHAMAVFKHNFPHVKHALETDLTKLTPEQFEHQTGIKPGQIDLIAGGPPCQGFSNVRQVDGSNHGSSNPDRYIKVDPRRELYKPFFGFVKHYQPKMFVMENVLGIRSAAAGRYYAHVKELARELGYRVAPYIIKAAEFGVPQKRVRQLVIGTRDDLPAIFSQPLLDKYKRKKETTLWEAIGDLPRLEAGEGTDPIPRDKNKLKKFLAAKSRDPWYLKSVVKANKSPTITAHRARPHSKRDLADFKVLREGETAAQAIARGEKMKFPYNRECFQDRYTRQHRNRLCSTIVAHLSKDGLMFIHPTQNRSLTPREAARVQSFPDCFHFPVPRTSQFRMIGNAVPPLVGRAVGSAAIAFLQECETKAAQQAKSKSGKKKTPKPRTSTYDGMPSADPRLVPANPLDAQRRIEAALGWTAKHVKTVDDETFVRGWVSVFWMMPGLHPDSMTDVSRTADLVSLTAVEVQELEAKGLDPNLFGPDDPNSGWPVPLLPLLREAWRRYEAGRITEDDMYPVAVVHEGWR